MFEFTKFIPRPEIEELYRITLTEVWYYQASHTKDDHTQLLAQIRELQNRLSNAQGLVTSKQIDPMDFRELKCNYSSKLEKPDAFLRDLADFDMIWYLCIDKFFVLNAS